MNEQDTTLNKTQQKRYTNATVYTKNYFGRSVIINKEFVGDENREKLYELVLCIIETLTNRFEIHCQK